MKQKKVIIGLSGGVDSSVAAALLLEQGYQVEAVYLECYNEPGCRTDQDKADALKVAMQLKIPFQVLDFRKEYTRAVVEYFYREYEAGRTPNPDVVCNREVKFGIFYDWAKKAGYDSIATGHYARLTPEFYLQRGVDVAKDQSYFLYQIPHDHLPHILFPLGGYRKSEVRSRAQVLNLLTADKPDSMGICFIGDVDVSKLLRDRLGERPGEVVYRREVVGSHRGLWFYTIGERGGFELNKQVMKRAGFHPEQMEPLYVISKEATTNRLIVGERSQTLTTTFQVAPTTLRPYQGALMVRIRNLGELYPVARFDGHHVVTQEPVFGVAEGQSAVFYARIAREGDEVVVGGATIV